MHRLIVVLKARMDRLIVVPKARIDRLIVVSKARMDRLIVVSKARMDRLRVVSKARMDRLRVLSKARMDRWIADDLENKKTTSSSEIRSWLPNEKKSGINYESKQPTYSNHSIIKLCPRQLA